MGSSEHSLEIFVNALLLVGNDIPLFCVEQEVVDREGIIRKSSSEDLRSVTAELSKHKKEVAKGENALSKVKPLVEMGTAKEQEAESTEQTQSVRVEQLEKELALAKQLLADTRTGLAKIKATNLNLKNKMAKFEQKKSSSNSKCVSALKAMEEVEAKHKQAIETSTKLSKRQEELKFAFRSFLN
ncbi:hypothetical protein PIB30_094704 [Stylosanthes scabra]|uniref:Uncharacterized protein n=1 Tax=Stylosanthes scabra TaxID=79078 RepID=A0ABU6VVL1_9FABA|nr:hypothetical protein [Stylosanthes scabra]